jgi:hypothetical protein
MSRSQPRFARARDREAVDAQVVDLQRSGGAICGSDRPARQLQTFVAARRQRRRAGNLQRRATAAAGRQWRSAWSRYSAAR